ncbi:gamma-aminobutyric acid type B receptor subunit 2-like isoform X5 [Acropora millepora]|uniref:gamma-aminobutyric acid type B receptor subunit 2-like isoform X5 n=1 Tax=Acropora millepora TaxID=45264 RepID=UPI001CF36612|nr:gamma-aminobutyric acid type B receptor subunit 2-like isoform X5 [Acropora millepora]
MKRASYYSDVMFNSEDNILIHVKVARLFRLCFCLISFCISEMKGKDVARVLFLALYFSLLFQATHCRLRFSNSFFCCQKLSANSNNFSCWNNTLEQGSFETASQTIENCTQNHHNLCFNVTSITESCPNDISSGSVDVGVKKKIQIGAFVPFLKSDKYGYAAVMKMAIDFINNRSDILQNYTLVLDSEDTKWATGAEAIQAFFNLLNKKNVPVILLGPSNTKSLEPIAEAAPKWKLVQVSYASGSPKFESKLTYPNTYRASPSSTSYSKAKAALIKYYGWNRVAILHQYDPEFFSPTVDKLKKELENYNISIIAVEGFEELGDVSFQMEKLKDLDARIIIGEFSNIGARNVFCEAFRRKMYGSRYAWIIFSESSPGKIFGDAYKFKGTLKCSSDEIGQAANRCIATTKLDIRQDNHQTISGMTSADYRRQLRLLSKQRNPRNDSAYVFDAAWVIALALNASLANNMTYEKLLDRSFREVFSIRDGIQQVDFQGLTGPVRFDQNRERIGTVLLQQNREGKAIRIGQHFTFSGELHIFESQKDKIWEDNIPPKDHTYEAIELMMNPLSLIIIMWLIAVLGVISSLSFLYFNINKGQNRIVKMSSPKLNNVIIVGCILCYTSVILFGLDARFLDMRGYGINCNVRTAVLSMGFSMSFGALFSKTWRVHKIFTAAKTLKKLAIKDLHLLGIVAGLLAVDVIVLSCWIAVDPLEAKELKFEELSRKEQDAIFIPALFHCTCKYKSYFLASLFAYKGLLLLFGLFLAWETRHVSIPALNDSKYIGMSVYNVFVLATIGVIVSIALDGSKYYEAPYAISSLCLIVCTTVTLLLVFVPKIHQFFMKDDNATKQAPSIHSINASRSNTQSHSFICPSPVLVGRHTAFASKATQTDYDAPGSAGVIY